MKRIIRELKKIENFNSRKFLSQCINNDTISEVYGRVSHHPECYHYDTSTYCECEKRFILKIIRETRVEDRLRNELDSFLKDMDEEIKSYFDDGIHNRRIELEPDFKHRKNCSRRYQYLCTCKVSYIKKLIN